MKQPLFFLVLLFIVTSSSSLAQKPSKVPARRDSVAVCQPDGKSVYLCLRGDERFHFHTTTDGYLVKKNRKGFYCYAKQTCRGEIKPSRKIARNIAERTKCDNNYLKRMRKHSKLYYKH